MTENEAIYYMNIDNATPPEVMPEQSVLSVSSLISRKEALERLQLLKKFNTTEAMQIAIDVAEQQINFCRTAFDKEKVIEELIELRQKEYSDSDEDFETMDGEEIYDEGRSHGKFEAFHRAIEIVEKGGLD